MKNLSTPEKFLLLAHHPEKRRFRISPIRLRYGLAGAFLLELTLEGAIEMQGDRLILKQPPPPDRPLMNEITGMFRELPKPRRIRYWVRRLGRIPGKYRWRVLGDLEQQRILRIEEHRMLGLIPYRRSILVKRKLQSDLIREIRTNVMQKKDPPDEWVALLGLIEACRMHRIVSADRTERKMIRKNLNRLLKESPIAAGVDQTIRQVQAAIIASVAASSAAATTAGR